MMLTQLYFLIFLAAAVLSAPLASRFGLGTVLGYLLAGVLIGPLLGGLALDIDAVLHISEYGIIMMLFLIGLDLQPGKLWRMRHDLIGIGCVQVVLTSLVGGVVTYWFGFPVNQAIAIGLILSLSSTAVVLQSLNELGLSSRSGGKMSLAVLILQDIAVIAMLAALPFLSNTTDQNTTKDSSYNALMNAWPVEARGLIIALVILLLFLMARHLVNPLFRYIAHARVREVFTAAALLLVTLITITMDIIGLSPALGAFLGGVVLSTSEYRHQLQSDIRPFKGLLMSVFFITIGASVNFNILLSDPITVIGLLIAIILIKIVIFWSLGLVARLGHVDRWLFALGMAQIGEFSLVLLGYAADVNVLFQTTVDYLILIVTLSMIATPALFILFQRFILPKASPTVQQNQAPETQFDESSIVIAGAGRFGQIVVRQLRAQGYKPLVIDYNVAQIESMARLGFKVFYGDTTDAHIFDTINLHQVEVFVITVGDLDHQLQVVQNVKRHNPNITVVTRARDRTSYFKLREAGANVIVRELFGSSNDTVKATLMALGESKKQSETAVQNFVEADERGLDMLYKTWQEERKITPRYFETARTIIDTFEKTVKLDNMNRAQNRHHHFDDGNDVSKTDLEEGLWEELDEKQMEPISTKNELFAHQKTDNK